MPKAAGKWNTFEVTAKGRQITVTLNGQKTVDLHNGMFEEGPFTLQYGSGVLKVRKLAVKKLSADPLRELCAASRALSLRRTLPARKRGT